MSEMPTAAPAPGYPVRFDVEYPEELSRLLIFVKWLFVLPVYIILALVGTAIPLAAFFTILVRGKYPEWWFKFVEEYFAFTERVIAYMFLLRDEYPALEKSQSITLEIDRPTKLNNFLPLVKWILAIPHFVILMALGFVLYAVILIAWFAILFTGKFPKGLFDFVVGVRRWNLRVSAYAFYLMTDEYPPFSLK